MKVLVTGEHSALPKALKVRGQAVEWIELPVLRFEALGISNDTKARLYAAPPDWIVFPSPRAVEFWQGAMGGVPARSRLAAIGRVTGELLGRAVAFVPGQPGSEGFFTEFEATHAIRGKDFLIAGAEGGRKWLPERLAAAGGQVERLALYRTLPLDGLPPIPLGVAAVLFTSPSSVEALLSAGPLPKGIRLLSMGKFTSESLKRRGLSQFQEIPDGDLARVGEIL